MSDDLVKKLRAGSIWGQSVQDTLIDCMKERKQAADRIEELETKLGEYNLLWQAYDGDLSQMYVDANEARIDAEAKLALAVETIAMCRKMQAQFAHKEDPLMVLIDTTLAELKGPQ